MIATTEFILGWESHAPIFHPPHRVVTLAKILGASSDAHQLEYLI